MKNLILSILCISTLFSFSNCNTDYSKQRDTPTTGKIKILVDENFEPVIDSQIQIFNFTYALAKVTGKYGPEAEMLQEFLKDTSKVLIIGRKLNENEIKLFQKYNMKPKHTLIAKDAIALIVNKNNLVKNVTTDQVKNILKGNIKNWNEVNKNAKKQNIQVVFDNKNSGTVHYLQNKCTDGNPFGAQCSALLNSKDVIKFVENNENAIGIIGVNWISDMEDPVQQAFLSNISVVAVAENELKESFQPYQAYIALNKYPFSREIYAISREMYQGLGTGFISFSASYKGQLIIQKSGIFPTNTNFQIRNVEVN